MGEVTANLSCMPSTCQAHCWPLHIHYLSDTQDVAAAISILQIRSWGRFGPSLVSQVVVKPRRLQSPLPWQEGHFRQALVTILHSSHTKTHELRPERDCYPSQPGLELTRAPSSARLIPCLGALAYRWHLCDPTLTLGQEPRAWELQT